MYTFKSTSDILVLQRNSLTMYLVILKIQMTGPHYTSELMPTCTCMTSLCDLQMYIFLYSVFTVHVILHSLYKVHVLSKCLKLANWLRLTSDYNFVVL